MYVHIGQGIMVRSNEIIAFIDKKSVELQRERDRDYLHHLNVCDLASEKFRTLVITNTKNYLSPFSTRHLIKQINNASNLDFKVSEV